MIMEKKEAMKILKDFYNKSALFSIRTALDTVIPELQESNDERIRKGIIRNLQYLMDRSEGFVKENLQERITWLEKQAKETSWKPSKEEMDVLYGLAYITDQYGEYEEDVITRLYQDLKREFFNGSSYENMFPTNTSAEDDVRRRSTIQVLEYAKSLDTYNQYGKEDINKNIAWLEKQKPNAHKREIDDAYLQGICDAKNAIEKQGEQTPTDKVEPKFKVGNWIVFNGLVLYIYVIVDGYYKTVDIDDIPCSYDWAIDNIARLWTINDAKDGDVLATSAGAFIYNSKNEGDNRPGYYCGINTLGKFQISSGKKWTNKEVYPATKEQRDLLFSKMHDAGYTWDSEKKELKKVEHKALNADKVIEWIKTHGNLWPRVTIKINEVIKQFKKDFEL